MIIAVVITTTFSSVSLYNEMIQQEKDSLSSSVSVILLLILFPVFLWKFNNVGVYSNIRR